MSECEYRFVLVENNSLTAIQNSYMENNAPKFFEYKNGFYTSYYQIEFSDQQNNAVKSITLSPSSEENYKLKKRRSL